MAIHANCTKHENRNIYKMLILKEFNKDQTMAWTLQ